MTISRLMPDCMMPDGGEACKEYAQLVEENERLQRQWDKLVAVNSETIDAIVKEQEENERLRKAIEDAPHSPECGVGHYMAPLARVMGIPDCTSNCWKRAALEEGEK